MTGLEIDFTRLPEYLLVNSERLCHTGSRAICVPSPTDTDDDYLVLAKPWLEDILKGQGWCKESADRYGTSVFHSWRKDDINLIVTQDCEFFRKFELATKVAAAMNVSSKKDRVTLFKAILYGTSP